MYHRIPTLLLLGHLHQDKGQPWQTPCRNSSTAVVTHSASGVSLGTGWGTAASVTCGDSAPVPTAMGREWSLVCQPGEDMEVPELVFWWLQEPRKSPAALCCDAILVSRSGYWDLHSPSIRAASTLSCSWYLWHQIWCCLVPEAVYSQALCLCLSLWPRRQHPKVLAELLFAVECSIAKATVVLPCELLACVAALLCVCCLWRSRCERSWLGILTLFRVAVIFQHPGSAASQRSVGVSSGFGSYACRSHMVEFGTYSIC